MKIKSAITSNRIAKLVWPKSAGYRRLKAKLEKMHLGYVATTAVLRLNGSFSAKLYLKDWERLKGKTNMPLMMIVNNIKSS
jgi:hypothetical protein